MAKKKAIFYLIDGARPDILQKLVDQNVLPNIKKYLIDEGSFVKGTTCFPSTTGPAYLPFLTGAFPGAHDITGIRWFDKKAFFNGRWKRNSMRSYCGYEAKFFNDDMDPKMPSLLETYPKSFNIYNMITKGVKDENDLTKKEKTKLYFRAHFKHEHHPVDENGHKRLMEGLDKDFEFIFAVFPSIDWDSHSYHYEDERTIESYKIVDRSLGEVVTKLKEQNSYEDTLIVMASDHGLSSTHTHFDIGQFFKRNKYRVLEYPSIWSINPKVAVFISGNSFATLSFLDQKEMYNIEDLMAKHGAVMKKFVSDDAIDFIAIRKENGNVAIVNEHGEAEVIIENGKVGYKSHSANPFKIDDTHQLMNDQDAFDYTFESDYPDALVQIKQLFASERTGDVVVSAKIGYDLRDFWEIPEHKGSHGSLHWEHMHIPFLTNKKDLVSKPVRTTEVYQFIRNHLDEK